MKVKKKSIAAFIFAICLVMPAILLFAACGKHEHTFSSDWTKTETQHWHACTGKNCNEKQVFQPKRWNSLQIILNNYYNLI